MEIQLEKIGKKFNSDWIFRDVNFSFREGVSAAILGRNGSGKSTLLQIVAGNLHPTEGTVRYFHQGKVIPGDEVFRYLTMVTPYLDLIEDFTMEEIVKFHFSFKSFLPGLNATTIAQLLDFPSMQGKPVSKFSSGMKQRLKLVLAILSDVPMILLDEPTMNLDSAGTDWYLNLLESYTAGRTILICSNLHQTESAFAGITLHIEDYKK